MYIYLAVFIVVLGLIYKKYNRIQNLFTIYSKIKKFIDPTGEKGCFYLLKMIGNILFTLIKSKLIKEKPAEKFNRNYIKISYNYKDKQYFYLLKVPRGVTPLQSICDENNINIENIIIPYLGPNLDCHGITLTPKDFGYKSITFTTVFDKVIKFEENDTIVL